MHDRWFHPTAFWDLANSKLVLSLMLSSHVFLCLPCLLHEMYSILRQHLPSVACSLPWSSTVRVYDSQAHRNTDATSERISRTLELREILLSFQTGFNLVSVAVVCATLESISRFEPSSVISEPRCLKFVTVSSFCPFTLISVLMRWCLNLCVDENLR